MKACLLLSGGMDSLALAYWKRPKFAITINYGQLAAEAEIEASSSIARVLGIKHFVLHIDCSSLGSGDMAGRIANKVAPESDWWPFRNQLLATLAGMKAISIGATHLWFGTVQNDEGHADGRQFFFDTMKDLMSSQEGGIVVEAPAIEYTTLDLIKVSEIPKELLVYAHSCHTSIVPCGRCRGCNKYNQIYETTGYDLENIR